MNKALTDMLAAYSHESERSERIRIEKTIWDRFGCERAVLVVDMSGFSRLSQMHGIVHYLSMIYRMQGAARPMVENHGGIVVKFEADNCFAVFPDTLSAVRAAIALNRKLQQDNRAVPDALQIYIACGIDYGEILLIDGADIFGTAMNRASKLGEDIASAGQILVTQDAYATVPEATPLTVTPDEFNISGIQIGAVSVQWDTGG